MRYQLFAFVFFQFQVGLIQMKGEQRRPIEGSRVKIRQSDIKVNYNLSVRINIIFKHKVPRIISEISILYTFLNSSLSTDVRHQIHFHHFHQQRVILQLIMGRIISNNILPHRKTSSLENFIAKKVANAMKFPLVYSSTDFVMP